MKLTLSLTGLFLLSLIYGAKCKSISSKNDPAVNSHLEEFICEELKNTYQVQVINTRSEIAFPIDICDRIKLNRHTSDTTYIRLYENARIMILPDNIIKHKDIPFLSDYIHIALPK